MSTILLCRRVYSHLIYYVRGIEPDGGIEHVASQILQSLLLTRLRLIGHRLKSRHIVDVSPTDALHHMVLIACELTDHLTVHHRQVFVLVVLLLRPRRQILHHTLQVLQSIFRSFHAVVTQIFRLSARVFVLSFSAEPQTRIVAQHLSGLLHQLLLLLKLVLELRSPLIAPLDGPLVVVVDAGEQSLLANLILRLCHVVETGIIHDAHRMTVGLHPLLVTQFLYRRGKRCTHVVAQPERVSHFVRRHEPHQLSHQLIVELHGLGAFVQRPALHHVPLSEQIGDIVEPADVRLYDFARTRVNNAGAVGILVLRRQIAQHAEACIVETHCVVILRPLLGHDGILEASSLEGHVPVVDALYQIGNPFLRCGRVDVIDDLFLRLNQLSCQILLLVLRHEAIARHERFVASLCLVVAELTERVDEVAHPVVPQPLAHRLFGQQHHRRVEPHRQRPRLRGSRGSWRRAVGASRHHLDVGGIHFHCVNKGSVRLYAPHLQRGLCA